MGIYEPDGEGSTEVRKELAISLLMEKIILSFLGILVRSGKKVFLPRMLQAG